MAFDFNIPTQQTLITRIVNDILARRGADALLRRSDDAVYGRVNAGAFYALYGMLKNLSKEVNVTTAVLTLDEKAGFWLSDDPRRQATAASGPITVTGTPGEMLAASTQFVSMTTGKIYAVKTDTVISGMEQTVLVEAVDAGKTGNLAAGEVLTIATPVGTIGATAISGGILGETDRESDDSLRARILDRIRQPPGGGDTADYIRWAKQVPGVTRVWVYPGEMGSGSVTLRFMRDGDPDPIPNATEVEKVYEHVREVCPVTVQENLYVVAPLKNAVDLTIRIMPDTDEVKAAITASVADFFARESEPGGRLYKSRLDEAISIAAGEFDHTLLSPTADVVARKGHINMLGNITWAD